MDLNKDIELLQTEKLRKENGGQKVNDPQPSKVKES